MAQASLTPSQAVNVAEWIHLQKLVLGVPR
jgi:hypothetical protein